MTLFSTGMNYRSFTWQITSLSFVLGLLLAAAWHTTTHLTRSGDGPHVDGFAFGSGAQVAAKKAAEYEAEINRLNKKIQEKDDQFAKRTDAASSLNQELKDVRIFAGLTEVDGPGVQVTLIDNDHHDAPAGDPLSLTNLIHDVDIAQVVNELKIAGAEAIAVNGHRIIATSTIRCVGPVVQVNGVPAAPPYVVQAVGDPEAMFGGVNLPNGVLDQLRRLNPNMVRLEKKQMLQLPAYAGSTQLHFGHPPKTHNEDTAKDTTKETSRPESKHGDMITSKAISNQSNTRQSSTKDANSTEVSTKEAGSHGIPDEIQTDSKKESER